MPHTIVPDNANAADVASKRKSVLAPFDKTKAFHDAPSSSRQLAPQGCSWHLGWSYRLTSQREGGPRGQKNLSQVISSAY